MVDRSQEVGQTTGLRHLGRTAAGAGLLGGAAVAGRGGAAAIAGGAGGEATGATVAATTAASVPGISSHLLAAALFVTAAYPSLCYISHTNTEKFLAPEPWGFNSPSAFGIYPTPAKGKFTTIFSHAPKEAPTNNCPDAQGIGTADSAAAAATFGLSTEASPVKG
uniref:Uncharacterized protein n=1 Tax=Chromera velia CCMP2878 TaxID=1169474 RepID=A0A0G4ID50_9ALVE|eukprot:Cvel_13252.t1-p1 / transcript=Cvel_13252.t1 / gene=Cvel_13252 / organism=Chromera_velia_CCMP2878 / gene_product=hypothetical protein / transcript_product=hypothetical protein / location=Cvel_scaffold898:37831-38730(+) / protein_length=164 / sequence_SO=supercontig / SO=protein_coding / is_pseudo=false